MFNVSKWKSDVKQLEADIRAHKKSMRASGHNPGTGEYAGLYEWKNKATMLYRIRAQYRNKLHSRRQREIFKGWFVEQQEYTIDTLDEQKVWISEDLWNEYVSADAPAVSTEHQELEPLNRRLGT